MALRREDGQEQQVGRIHQRYSGNGQDLRADPTSGRNQLFVRSQETPIQAIGSSSHQGDHQTGQLHRDLPGRLHCRSCVAKAGRNLQVRHFDVLFSCSFN